VISAPRPIASVAARYGDKNWLPKYHNNAGGRAMISPAIGKPAIASFNFGASPDPGWCSSAPNQRDSGRVEKKPRAVKASVFRFLSQFKFFHPIYTWPLTLADSKVAISFSIAQALRNNG
jgi:hypothetical protein